MESRHGQNQEEASQGCLAPLPTGFYLEAVRFIVQEVLFDVEP
jgi:hypothetical protein